MSGCVPLSRGAGRAAEGSEGGPAQRWTGEGDLQVVLATSLQDGGRQAALALSAALDAAAHGSRVYVFLALESTTLGTPTGVFAARPAGFDRELGDYVSELMRLGGRVAVCSSCYREYCRHLPQRDDGKGAVLRERVVVESLATLAERAQAMPTLCF